MKRRARGGLHHQVYECIVAYSNANGMPPALREIGQAVGVESTGYLDHLLKGLEKQGLIARHKGISRGITLTQPVGIPVIGTIAAGTPLDIVDPTSRISSEVLLVKHAFQVKKGI